MTDSPELPAARAKATGGTTTTGFTVRTAVAEPLYVAVIVVVKVEVTVRLVAVKVAVVVPAGTGTLTGTVAADLLLLDNATVAPPEGAGALKVTVPVELVTPPVTLVGFKLSEVTEGGVTVSVAVADPPKLAVMVTLVVELTATDVIVKVVELVLAGTVTLIGTVAAAVLLLFSVTVVPLAGAVPFRVTVAVELATPPSTLVGFRLTETTAVARGVTVSVAV